MMSNVPRLRHLELMLPRWSDVMNGERGEMIMKDLITLKFAFLYGHMRADFLDSFRTSFWLEEKHWFVAFHYGRLFSVPDFCRTETDQDFKCPLYSTVPDKKIFYESINQLRLYRRSQREDHYFPNVQTLSIYYPIRSWMLEKIVDLSQVRHVILGVSLDYFTILSFINAMPNLCQLSIESNIRRFIKRIPRIALDKIRILQLSNRRMDMADYHIDKLCAIFPNIEQLHLKPLCSSKEIWSFLNRLKRLSLASFRYTHPFDSFDQTQESRLKIQSDLDRIRSCGKFDYTYRFDQSSVHIWL
jgi:hypothetical protein